MNPRFVLSMCLIAMLTLVQLFSNFWHSHERSLSAIGSAPHFHFFPTDGHIFPGHGHIFPGHGHFFSGHGHSHSAHHHDRQHDEGSAHRHSHSQRLDGQSRQRDGQSRRRDADCGHANDLFGHGHNRSGDGHCHKAAATRPDNDQRPVDSDPAPPELPLPPTLGTFANQTDSTDQRASNVAHRQEPTDPQVSMEPVHLASEACTDGHAPASDFAETSLSCSPLSAVCHSVIGFPGTTGVPSGKSVELPAVLPAIVCACLWNPGAPRTALASAVPWRTPSQSIGLFLAYRNLRL